MKKLVWLFAILLLTGCATSVKSRIANKQYQPLADGISVYILNLADVVPPGSEPIGEIKVGDSGFTTDCGYNKVMADAQLAAKKAGANIIKLTQLKEPSFGSTCYRIKANLYRNFDEAGMAAARNSHQLRNKSSLPEGSDYAVIHFYRPSSAAGVLLGFKIKNANDSIVGRLRNAERFSYKTKKFGPQRFYGSLETTEEVTIDVQPGQEYFVRCGVTMGIVFGRPDITLISGHIGRREFAEMN